MLRIYLISLVILITPFIYAEKPAKIVKIPNKSKPFSALILFSGDYKSKYQFDGLFQQEITGVFVDSAEYISDKDCEIIARFQKVIYAKVLHLKIDFTAICKVQEVKLKSILTSEYVRLKDLKTHSSSLYLSEQHKNVQFKLIEFND